MADVETLKQMCVYPPECLDDARHAFTKIVNRKHLRYPDTIEEAIQFFRAYSDLKYIHHLTASK